jgi:hypothetical protein
MTTINLIIEAGNKIPSKEVWNEILKSAKYFNKNQIAHVWNVDDVIERAKQIKVKVSKARAREILKEVDRRNKDANYGISWETFDYFIEQ